MRNERRPISFEQWCKLAKKPTIQDKIRADGVVQVYPALIAHCARTKNLEWADVVVDLHIVFGWMPRMLKLQPLADMPAAQRCSLVGLLQMAKQGELLILEEVAALLPLTSSSSIGLSKLLHFLCPAKYPIWDRRVASAFLRPQHPKPNHPYIRTAARFVEYRDTLLTWSAEPDAEDYFRSLQALHKDLREASGLRFLEIVLWHAGKE